jgi:hypothetical protein
MTSRYRRLRRKIIFTTSRSSSNPEEFGVEDGKTCAESGGSMKVATAIAVALTFALGVSFSAAAQEELHIKKKMPPLPDLVIMKATRDKAAGKVTVWVMNRAPGSKATNCTLKLFAYKYKNALELIDPSELEKVEYTRPVPELAGGQSYTTSFEIPKQEGEIRTALARLIVDSENDVTESKEGNNEWSFKSKQVTARDEDRRVPEVVRSERVTRAHEPGRGGRKI